MYVTLIGVVFMASSLSSRSFVLLNFTCHFFICAAISYCCSIVQCVLYDLSVLVGRHWCCFAVRLKEELNPKNNMA